MIASIKEKLEKIKGQIDLAAAMDKNSFVLAVLLLVALISFGLGRLSGLETAKRDVEIQFPEGQSAAAYEAAYDTGDTPKAPAKTSGTYMASKNGTKYYLPTCGSSKRISETNRVWFDTKEEAESAGYSPAANCPGL